jgi:hypothetical protein
MVPPENAVLPEPFFTLTENAERGGYRTRLEKDAAMTRMGNFQPQWTIHARVRPDFGDGSWRIVAVAKKAPGSPESLPFFSLTSCGISSPAAFKLVHVRQNPMTPNLKAFIDGAIVPALVKEWLAQNHQQNPLAPSRDALEGVTF